MIQSMTGFGKEVVQLSSKTITIEVKSLNSKGLDIYLRIPQNYREKEIEIRDRIAKTLERGKVDLSILVDDNSESGGAKLNEAVIRNYMAQLNRIVDGDQTELLKMAVRMPDALKTENEDIDDEEYQEILLGLDRALDSLKRFRKDEGKVLEEEFSLRINNISNLLKEVIALDVERLDEVRVRLQKAVSDLKEQIDENRFEQELIYYLEKFDITEEKVRLQSHLDYFKENLDSSDSNGKKLNFITQEIGREINTIGSKANHAPMQKLVVQMKDELEKIKEQTLNVL